MAGNIELLSSVLATARAEGRAALVGYLPAGFPTVDDGVRAITAMVEGGCDVVEVGLPHSDPVLDGPVIQTADDIALRGGVRIVDVIRTVREAHAATGAPVLCMTYWNPVDAYGVERFAADLAEAGGAGCILPDLPVEESEVWRKAAEQHGLATVFVVAPSSRDERLAKITAAGSGFVYAASLMGVTGTRASVGLEAEELVRRTRAVTELPVCVGLGVSNARQAEEVARFADGVIVGSAFVKRLLDAPDLETGLAGVRALAGELAAGVAGRA
ncbi:tryptophan synthase subunit alpha [Streptomyces syringium]|uniref:Tryptophan synthase alpha chain n=1 Tax=Streptomyces syringium TaxID=76729 RepID=A0ABS4Y0Q1_9ACTN|nr:tryptophan synthase subunit alpha [Streptomyces syringium]MBP2402337.1 tryptophan synthase alpha chain [Streptomyces syringium]SPE49234.1 Tryptophan synthase alpha chain [Streptomyces netropsis]